MDACKACGKYRYFLNLLKVYVLPDEVVFKIEIVLTLKIQIQMILCVLLNWTH